MINRTKRETDYLQQLAEYIKKNLSKGYTAESLKWALINQGHSRIEAEKAMTIANEQLAAAAPKMIEKPVIKIEVEPEIILEEQSFWQKVKSWFS